MPARRRRLTRHDLDVRLGYTGLGVGAVGFVLVLVASLIVIEVGPRADLPEPFAARGQLVVRYPVLEEAAPADRIGRETEAGAAERGRPGGTRPAAGAPDPVIEEPVAEEPVTEQPGNLPTAGGPDDHDGGGSTPRDPGAPAADGPLSQAVDPVVHGLTAAVDSTTGGATAPVTGPLGGVVDDVTDLGDGLLPRP